MLVLTRREGESIQVGGDVVVTICRVEGKKVRVGITAPNEVHIRRTELPETSYLVKGGQHGEGKGDDQRQDQEKTEG